MLKIEKTDVYGWEAAIRGMRNPMNSWDKSDTGWIGCRSDAGDFIDFIDIDYDDFKIKVIGENDLKLMKSLSKAGSDHSKFMRMINVTCDITAPRFWWTEFDTYRIGVEKNSCSTMHTIHKKPFEREDFSVEYICKVPQNRVPIIVKSEEWRETEYEGVYVSNSGKVKQAAREITRSDGKVICLPEREIAVTEDDYLRVKLHTVDGTHSCKLHRLMAKAFIDNPFNYPVVNHRDGNKLNCNLDNLEWCTSSYNRQHACDNGMVNWSKESREACGKRSRKLTDEQVNRIKELRDKDWTLTDIAEYIGCAVSTVSRILSGKLYVETRDTLDLIIDNLNTLREMYLETGDTEYWRQIIELLPQSYNQKRTVQLNYQVLKNMYHSRKAHKLDEWVDFCKWIEMLPYSEIITCE